MGTKFSGSNAAPGIPVQKKALQKISLDFWSQKLVLRPALLIKWEWRNTKLKHFLTTSWLNGLTSSSRTDFFAHCSKEVASTKDLLLRFDQWSSRCRRLVRKRWEGVLAVKVTRGWIDSHHLRDVRVPAPGVYTQSVMSTVVIRSNLMGCHRTDYGCTKWCRQGDRKSAGRTRRPSTFECTWYSCTHTVEIMCQLFCTHQTTTIYGAYEWSNDQIVDDFGWVWLTRSNEICLIQHQKFTWFFWNLDQSLRLLIEYLLLYDNFLITSLQDEPQSYCLPMTASSTTENDGA